MPAESGFRRISQGEEVSLHPSGHRLRDKTDDTSASIMLQASTQASQSAASAKDEDHSGGTKIVSVPLTQDDSDNLTYVFKASDLSSLD